MLKERSLFVFVTLLQRACSVQVAVTGYNDKIAIYNVLEQEPWFELAWQAPVIPNQTWMQIVNGVIYASNELGEWDGEQGGVVSGWKVNGDSVVQTQTVSLPSPYPAHLLVDPSHGMAYTANYGGSSFVALEFTDEDGVGAPVLIENYENCRDDSHPHQVVTLGEWLWVVDLGCDSIWHYRVTEGIEYTGQTSVTAGAGPRHMVIIEERNLAVLVCELKSIVELFSLNPTDGSLTSIQQLHLSSTTGDSGGEILLGPNRDFIYASSRVTGVVVVYRLNTHEDSLERLQELTLGSIWPRSMVIKDQMLMVASKWDNALEMIKIDQDTGLLEKPENNMFTNTPDQPAFIMLLE